MRRIFETQQVLMAQRIEKTARSAKKKKIKPKEWKRLTDD